jgi:hypothetical protein
MPKDLSQINPNLTTIRPQGSVRLLAKVRRWFEGEGEEEGRDDSGQQDGQGGGDDLQKRLTALEKRIQERDAEIASLKQQRDAADKANKQRLTEEGKYKDLYEQALAEIETYKPYKNLAETRGAVIQAGNEKNISLIPEDRRSIVPDLSPEALHDWLSRSLHLLTKAPSPDFDAGAGANGGGGGHESKLKLTPEERLVLSKTGMSEEDFIKSKKSLGQSLE